VELTPEASAGAEGRDRAGAVLEAQGHHHPIESLAHALFQRQVGLHQLP